MTLGSRLRPACISALLAVGVTCLLAMPTPAEAAFPGANGKIAFARGEDIYVMSSVGARQTRIKKKGSDPAWSADGRKIAFSSVPISRSEIYTMRADGSKRRRLTDSPLIDARPTWSPNGARIAYANGTNHTTHIYTINADGSKRRALAGSPFSDIEPAWSPDGRKIAFASLPFKDIFVMSATGSGATRLTGATTNPVDSEDQPAWSPNGRKIAFASDLAGNAEIYTMNADGSGQTRLTNSSASDSQPAWSPDGRKIAFASDRDGNAEIYTMNADGSGVRRLTSNDRPDVSPDWQPLRPRSRRGVQR